MTNHKTNKVGTIDLSKIIHLNPHLAIQTPGKKKSKYNNIKTEVDGEVFDSAKEAKRYGELKLMEKAGEITGLCKQVSFKLSTCKYVADFVYYEVKQKEWIVEDVKSDVTKKLPVFRLKKKAMMHELEILIKEV